MSNASQKYIPKKCVFETTLACNLQCKHCGSRAGRKRDDELTTSEVADLFGQLKGLGCERVVLSGGEPMMRTDWLELIEAGTRVGMRMAMITNAVAFDTAAAKAAVEKGLTAVGFSVDGMRETHDKIRGKVGHFNRLLQAMAVCREIGLPFAVVTFLNSMNRVELDELHDTVAAEGAYAWQVQLGSDMGNLHDNPHLLIEKTSLPSLHQKIAGLIKRDRLRIAVADSIGYYGPFERTLRRSVGGKPFSGCGAGMRNVGIESNGNVKGCLSIMAGYNAEGADFVEGNIRTESLAEIWNREGAFSYTRDWTPDKAEGFCATCKHLRQCRGGCTGKMVASGTRTQNPQCVYRIVCEQDGGARQAGRAAAVALASVVGTAAMSCHHATPNGGNEQVEVYGVPDTSSEIDTSTDTDTETATDTGTATDDDTAIDTGTESDVDEYGLPDTDTESVVDPYGVPDTDSETETGSETDVDWYGLPDTDSETDLMEYGMPDTDTETIDAEVYGMPGVDD